MTIRESILASKDAWQWIEYFCHVNPLRCLKGDNKSIEGRHNHNKEDKNKNQEVGKALDSTHCIVAHYNIGINEITSLSSYKDCRLLDISATSHMTFRKDCFEEPNDIKNDIVYFAETSSLKPRGIGSIRLKLSGFLDFVLKNVLYIPELQRSLLSLV